MPGGTVFPTAARELHGERVRAQTQAKKGGEISLEAEYTPRALGEGDARRAYKDLNSTLSDAERLRLKTLGDALVLNTRSIYDTTSDRRLKNGGKLAYEFENRRIRKVIREKRPLRIAPGIRARELNGLFESMRVEVDATKAILRAWRRYCIRKMWKEKAAQAIVIKRIQRIARGFITRRLVAEWFHSRQRMVVQWQARMRKWIDLHGQNGWYDGARDRARALPECCSRVRGEEAPPPNPSQVRDAARRHAGGASSAHAAAARPQPHALQALAVRVRVQARVPPAARGARARPPAPRPPLPPSRHPSRAALTAATAAPRARRCSGAAASGAA